MKQNGDQQCQEQASVFLFWKETGKSDLVTHYHPEKCMCRYSGKCTHESQFSPTITHIQNIFNPCKTEGDKTGIYNPIKFLVEIWVAPEQYH